MRRRRAGSPVFIDFTAAWCLSCQVNERLVLTVHRCGAGAARAQLHAAAGGLDERGCRDHSEAGVPWSRGCADVCGVSRLRWRHADVLPELLTKERVLRAIRTAGGGTGGR